MADETTGTTTYDVNLVTGDDGEKYIDGMTVTGPTGSNEDYKFRPSNFAAVEAARKAAEDASDLANAAARNADSATASASSAASYARSTADSAASDCESRTNAAVTAAENATSAANASKSACDTATGQANAAKAACDEAVANAKNLLPLGLYLDENGDICQKEE